MRRPSRERRKNSNKGNDPGEPGLPRPTIGIDQIDENRLHPIGIPGINLLEPNLELVDPMDWFLQPIFGNNLGYDINITISEDGCIICVSVSGALGWLEATEGNGIGFCYVMPHCRQPEPPPPPPLPPEYPPDLPKPCAMPPGGGLVRVEFMGIDVETYSSVCGKGDSSPGYQGASYWSQNFFLGKNTQWVTTASQNIYTKKAKCPYKESRTVTKTVNHFDIDLYDETKTYIHSYAGGSVHSGEDGYGGHYPEDGDIWQVIIRHMTIPVSATVIAGGSDSSNKLPPPPPPEDEDMACCRNQQNSEELLRKIARCVGTQTFPVTVPKSFNRQLSGTERIGNIPEYQRWSAVQLSDLIGEFPKKIKIDDVDLVQEGDQGVEIDLPNLSETLADMYGTAIRGTALSEVLLAFCTRMASELCSIKAATLVSQSYSKANAYALGYKFQEEKTEVPFSFNYTADAAKVEDFLESSIKKITTFKCDEEYSAWEYFERMFYVMSLLKAKILKKDGVNLNETIERIKNSGLFGDSNLDKFLEKLTQDGFINIDDNHRQPDIKEE